MYLNSIVDEIREVKIIVFGIFRCISCWRFWGKLFYQFHI